jgi:N-methylhydantoinase B
MNAGDQATAARDAVTFEIIRGKLLAAADEMGVVLARTSMSPVIYEVLDFACGIVDTEAQVISQTNGITVFTGTFAGHVNNLIGRFGGAMRPGDIYMANDPYEGGTHLSDVAIVKPIFVDDEVIAYSIAVAHWTDIGGKVAGSLPMDATEIFHEGLRFTGQRIYDAGERSEDLVDLIAANTRIPKMSLGDLNAELASVRIAEARLLEICEKYGAARTKDAFRYMLTTSERLSRAAISALPDGVYEADDFIDGDGVDNEPFPVCVAVRIAGDSITFDFTGSSPQRRGPVNCAWGAHLSAVKTAFKALVSPHEPGNEGWFKPLSIIVPEGSVFSAVYPAPVCWHFEAGCHASELIWKALAPLAPDRYGAGSYLSLCSTFICGTNPESGEPFIVVEPNVGGWGASNDDDGASALIGVSDGDTYNTSVELCEAKYPVRIRRYALNTEDGTGAGRYRGGFGVVRDYEILADDAFVYGSMGRSITPPWGMDGGGEGSTNYIQVRTNGHANWRGARVSSTDVGRGQVFSIVTGGGGGYGDPRSRPAEAVASDVADGYITTETARSAYGVVVGENGALDVGATAAARGL